jgi:hypothetical protein
MVAIYSYYKLILSRTVVYENILLSYIITVEPAIFIVADSILRTQAIKS